MKVYIGADHRGFGFKKKIIAMLEQLGHKVVDLGTYTDQQPCDYPDIARELGEHVAKDRDSRGILVCMSGIGLTIAANKVKGVYAALCYNLEAAELSRQHNNANVLVLGSKFIVEKDLFQMLETWMTTPFEGGRHLARVKKIMEMEEGSAPKAASAKPDAAPAPEERPRAAVKERTERSERPDREARSYSSHREDREDRPHSSDRGSRRDEGRSSYSGKPPYRKDEGRSYSGKPSYGTKKPYSGERSYGKPAGRSDSRGEGRPSYSSRRPDSRTYSDRPSRPGSPDRESRRDEGRSSYSGGKSPYRKDEGRSYSGKPSYGTKKPYSGERSYGKPAGRSDSRGEGRPSYASRRPDERFEKRGERREYSERKPFSSGKPKFSPKTGARSSAPRKKFDKS